MATPAASADAYLAALPPDRRQALAAVRAVIRANLPPGFEEGVQFGMIAYHVPLARYPDTYNKQPLCLAALAAQKQHLAVYLMGVYVDDATRQWFEDAYARSGKRLDMGKSCLRFTRADDVALDVLGQAIARWTVDAYIAQHERARGAATKPRARKAAAAEPAARKPTAREPTARKPAARKPTARKPTARKPAATPTARKRRT